MAPARSCLPFYSHEARGRLLAVWALFRLGLSHFHYSCSCTVVAKPAPEELTAVDSLFTSCSNRQDTICYTLKCFLLKIEYWNAVIVNPFSATNLLYQLAKNI